MRKSLPFVQSTTNSSQSGHLNYRADGHPEFLQIRLDEPAWFEWLTLGQSFRVLFWNLEGRADFNVLPDQRKGRPGLYWSGWKSIRGKTKKFYLGITSKVTKARLDQAGEFFVAELNRDQAELINVPFGWEALTAVQKGQVEEFIQTLSLSEG